MFGGDPCPPLYIRGDRVTWKVLAEYSWSPTTTTQSDSFLCIAASSTPIRVVIKEVRYIHKLSLILEHSMSISSSAVPGLTPVSAPCNEGTPLVPLVRDDKELVDHEAMPRMQQRGAQQDFNARGTENRQMVIYLMKFLFDRSVCKGFSRL